MIVWQDQGSISIATISRPERRNALNEALCAEFAAGLSDRSDTRCVVLTGEGTAFCAGADLVTRFDGEGVRDSFRPAFTALLEAMGMFPGVIIAAINGPALGAGTQLAVGCDLRVAGPMTQMGIPAVNIGLMLDPSNVERLVATVGMASAKELLLTGERIGPEAAKGIGLVHRIADDPVAEAVTWAELIATKAPLSVSGHKQLIHLASGLRPLAAGEDAETVAERYVDAAFESADVREGLAAFADKRRPQFNGD
jgi:enoyl-CoA hydratase